MLSAPSGTHAAELPAAAMMSAGKETVRIVCFGDSITGVYYHTGGRRAYCDMLEIALKKIYPRAKLKMVNAGISGHDTRMGLRRMKNDVLAHKPHLVVIMYGMNDCPRVTAEVFGGRLTHMVKGCQASGADVVVCTPNSIYPEDRRRPVEKLAAVAEAARVVAKKTAVPLADCYRAYEDTRAANALDWKLLMSETIHPNMNGHKLFAEVMAEAISGKRVNLDAVPHYSPCLPFTLKLLAAKKPLKVTASPPYDVAIPKVLRKLCPDAVINMTVWPVKGQSLGAIERWARRIRKAKPNLVVVAVPADVAAKDETQYIRSYCWVLNWSVDFGIQTWDTIAVLPNVAQPDAKPVSSTRAALTRRLVVGQDIGFVERKPGDESSLEDILLGWFQSQQGEWTAAARK